MLKFRQLPDGSFEGYRPGAESEKPPEPVFNPEIETVLIPANEIPPNASRTTLDEQARWRGLDPSGYSNKETLYEAILQTEGA